MIKRTSGTTTPIIVSRTHPEVAEFYRGRWPKLLRERPEPTVESSKATSGHGVMVEAYPAQRLASPTISTRGGTVVSNENSWLQSSTLGTSTFAIPNAPVATPSVIGLHGDGSASFAAGAEGRLQRLEDENLRLKMEYIMKDREIRLLRIRANAWYRERVPNGQQAPEIAARWFYSLDAPLTSCKESSMTGEMIVLMDDGRWRCQCAG